MISYLKYIIIVSIIIVGCSRIQTVENKLASEAYNEGKYLTAITYANEMLEKDSSNVEALLVKGKSELKLNNYSDAVLDFSKVLRNRKSFDAYYYRARAYLELNELEKSASDLDNALKYNSNNVEALFDLGYVQTLLGNYDSALDAYKRVINVDPSNYKAYVNIGNLKGRTGEDEEAIKDFSRAISLSPNDALGYFNRATERLIIGNKQGAIEDLKIAVSIDSSNINSFFLLAETQMQVNDINGAINILNKIIKLNAQNPRAYYLRGLCELYLNHKEVACKNFKKAGELGYYDAYELITKNCKPKSKKKNKR